MNTQKPVDITVDRSTSSFVITWKDGHKSVTSFTLLRNACPCAECRGGHENMSLTPDEKIFSLPDEDTPATRIRNVEAVGTYAITILWEDGHHFGIYRWSYLRALCSCEQCRL